MTLPRVRPVAFVVQPQLVLDDGETLTPLQAQAFSVPAAEWPEVQAAFDVALAAMQAKVDDLAQSAPPGDSPGA